MKIILLLYKEGKQLVNDYIIHDNMSTYCNNDAINVNHGKCGLSFPHF